MAVIPTSVLARLRRAAAAAFHGRGAVENEKSDFDLSMQALEDEFEPTVRLALRAAITSAVGAPTFDTTQEDDIIAAWMVEKGLGNI